MKNKNGFYWGTVFVQMTVENSEQTFEVRALIYRNSGLCINQYDIREPKGRFNTVSHISSGCKIGHSFYDSRTARLFCVAISDLVDWNIVTTTNILTDFSNLGAKLKVIRNIVVEHKKNWKTELMARILLNGRLEEE